MKMLFIASCIRPNRVGRDEKVKTSRHLFTPHQGINKLYKRVDVDTFGNGLKFFILITGFVEEIGFKQEHMVSMVG